MLTELTFAILKYGFLILLWIFVACTVRSLYKDIETFSPRKSRAHRRKERRATGNTITLGRAASNTVVLDDEFVSSHHARVYTDPATGQWAIEDLGSTNGTVVNQQRLDAPMILGSRVPVRIGATTFELR